MCTNTHTHRELIQIDEFNFHWLHALHMNRVLRNEDEGEKRRLNRCWAFPASIRVVSKIDYRTLIISFNYRYCVDSFFLSFLPALLLSDSVNLIRSAFVVRVKLRWVEILGSRKWLKSDAKGGIFFNKMFITRHFTKHPTQKKMYWDKISSGFLEKCLRSQFRLDSH